MYQTKLWIKLEKKVGVINGLDFGSFKKINSYLLHTGYVSTMYVVLHKKISPGQKPNECENGRKKRGYSRFLSLSSFLYDYFVFYKLLK